MQAGEIGKVLKVAQVRSSYEPYWFGYKRSIENRTPIGTSFSSTAKTDHLMPTSILHGTAIAISP